MPIQTANPLQEDPLLEYSGLSLFARTFASHPNPPRTNDSDDLNISHNFLKSMHVGSSTRLLEQGKEIVNGSPKLMDFELQSNASISDEAFCPDQERRPDLGRNKRARFSLKPKLSQPTVNLSPPPDVKKFRDPEDFFAAYEKHKNAKKELQKMAGVVLTDWNLNDVDMNERPRRQGTLGRRSGKYTHHTYNHISSQENCDEEILIPSIPSSQKEKDIPNVDLDESEKRELAGSVTEAENRVNQLLDGLLAENYEQLEGDGAVTLLQERLQIKPLHFEKLSLPDLQAPQTIDLKAFGENLPNPKDSLLVFNSKTQKYQASSSGDNVASSPPSKSPLASVSLLSKQVLQSNQVSDPLSLDIIDSSPTRTASPTKMVNKESNQVEGERPPIVLQHLDFAMTEDDATEVASASFEVGRGGFTGRSGSLVVDEPKSLSGTGKEVPGRSHQLESAGEENATDVSNDDDIGVPSIVSKHSDQTGAGKEVLSSSPLFESAAAEENATKVAAASFELERGDFIVPSDNVVINLSLRGSNPGNDDYVEISNNVNEQFEKFETEKELPGMSLQLESPELEEHVTSVAKANSAKSKQYISGQFDSSSNENPCNHSFGLKGSIANKKDIIEGTHESDKMDCMEVAASLQRQINMQDSTVDKANGSQRVSDDVNIAPVTDHAMDGSSQVAKSGSKSREEKVSKVTSPLEDKKRVTRPRKELKKRESPRRQSLAGFGTMVSENGIRRSTRLRSRPLEYWKGEKFLYGRIHGSLATVIGIKYESPGKTGEAAKFKVKSFVSDKYQTLVEEAARF